MKSARCIGNERPEDDPKGFVQFPDKALEATDSKKGRTAMYIYWRVQQDLSEMGNTIIFYNPSLIRAFKKWCTKNAASLIVAEGLGPKDLLNKRQSLN
jgi:hypothetical protein